MKENKKTKIMDKRKTAKVLRVNLKSSMMNMETKFLRKKLKLTWELNNNKTTMTMGKKSTTVMKKVAVRMMTIDKITIDDL